MPSYAQDLLLMLMLMPGTLALLVLPLCLQGFLPPD